MLAHVHRWTHARTLEHVHAHAHTHVAHVRDIECKQCAHAHPHTHEQAAEPEPNPHMIPHQAKLGGYHGVVEASGPAVAHGSVGEHAHSVCIQVTLGLPFLRCSF